MIGSILHKLDAYRDWAQHLNDEQRWGIVGLCFLLLFAAAAIEAIPDKKSGPPGG